jgi:multidrug efflux pump subunit AcrA (membrane-fusion protein)
MSSLEPEIHDSSAVQVADLAVRRGREQAWKRFAEAGSVEEFCGSWLAIQCHVIGGVNDGVVVLQKPGSRAFAPVAFFPDLKRDRSHLAQITERALKEGRGVVNQGADSAEADPTGSRCQLAYPVRVDGQLRGVVGMDLEVRPEPQIRTAMRDLQWGSGWLEVLLRRHADPQDAARLRLKLALDLISSLIEHEGLKQGVSAFTTELASRLGCDRVTLGLLKGERVKVWSMSHSGQFDRRANLMRAVEEAMDEAIDQRSTVVYPPERSTQQVVAISHANLVRESESGSAVTLPLESGGKAVGALTLERAPGLQFDPLSVEICEAVAAVAGPIIELKRGNERGLLGHVGQSVGGLWSKFFGPGHPLFKLAALGTVALAAFLSFATGDYRLSANATVEGEIQRAISAPFNGYIKEALLRAGDTAKAGEVIARLDDRELRLERIRLLGQRGQYIKQHREAMAKHDRTQAGLVSAQLEQVEAQLDQVEEQLSRIELIVPFDGVIVSGDLSQKLGSPVERGQVMFEVAPLEDFRVILKVDERDLAEVEVGQKGELTVASIPEDRLPFTVTKITSVNVAEEGRNVFRVEAALDDPGSRLRPGMEGVGKIYVDERKLVWIWTHTLTDWVRLWVWSWLP